ncbi:MAG: NCS2 family permease [Deltaproteobacteria bacterium]|nr:NCS2 family permease [Deltaproteobacteria bacterium]
MFERIFRLSENGTTVRTEILAGVTTFLTMAYIIVVQPLVLSGQMFGFDTGMDFGSVMTATCLSAALATAVMGFYARYPIALAPGMGENFFFVFSILPAAAAAMKTAEVTGIAPWEVGLWVVVASGVLFVLITLLGWREMIVNAVSPSLKSAMAVGIGLFIAFIGLQNSGLIVKSAGTLVQLNAKFYSIDLIVFFAALILTAVLHARRVRGSILWGIAGATALSVAVKLVILAVPDLAAHPVFADSKLARLFTLGAGVVSTPPAIGPTFFKMKMAWAIFWHMVPFIIILLFMDVFDTIGTLIGVSEQAGFIKDNKLPRADRALMSDAIGTLLGGITGTSTVTSFIESAAGVEQGGRTGLTALTVSAMFLLALFFAPLVNMVASYPCITSAALVVVGAMMMGNAARMDWKDYSESIPGFLIILGIPLSYSIADGLALGLITYPVVKLFAGKRREVGLLMYVTAALLILYFLFVRSGI